MSDSIYILDGGEERAGAYNSASPVFFRAAVKGKDTLAAFPDEAAVRFYVRSVKQILGSLPIEINAYSVLPNAVYFVFASADKSPVSVRNFLAAAGENYSRYYSERFLKEGNVFKRKIKIKRIGEYSEVLPAIVSVHARPVVLGLAADYSKYPFTSYNEKNGSGISGLTALYKVSGKDETKRDYVAAHAAGITEESEKFYGEKEKDKFVLDLERTLADNGCAGELASSEALAKVLIEMCGAGYLLDDVLHELRIKKAKRFDVIKYAVKDLMTRLDLSYDSALSRLGLPMLPDYSLFLEIVLEVAMETGRSYEHIMHGAGMAYPNLPFLKTLVEEYSSRAGVAVTEAIERLGIYDKEVIKELVGRKT
jgi:hypothetical protein